MQHTISVINIPQFQDQASTITSQRDKVYTYLRQLRRIESYIKTYEVMNTHRRIVPDDIEHLQIRTYWE